MWKFYALLFTTIYVHSHVYMFGRNVLIFAHCFLYIAVLFAIVHNSKVLLNLIYISLSIGFYF